MATLAEPFCIASEISIIFLDPTAFHLRLHSHPILRRAFCRPRNITRTSQILRSMRHFPALRNICNRAVKPLVPEAWHFDQCIDYAANVATSLYSMSRRGRTVLVKQMYEANDLNQKIDGVGVKKGKIGTNRMG